MAGALDGTPLPAQNPQGVVRAHLRRSGEQEVIDEFVRELLVEMVAEMKLIRQGIEVLIEQDLSLDQEPNEG